VVYAVLGRVETLPAGVDQLVRLHMPTPDMVLVRNRDGRLILFADDRVSDHAVCAALLEFGAILGGLPYPLGCVVPQ